MLSLPKPESQSIKEEVIPSILVTAMLNAKAKAVPAACLLSHAQISTTPGISVSRMCAVVCPCAQGP